MATPPQAKLPVIRVDPLAGRDSWRQTMRAAVAWVASAALPALLIFLFWMVVGDPRASANADGTSSAETINATVEAPETKEPPLTVETVGLDTVAPSGFDSPRVEDFNAPGPVNPY